MLPTEMDTAVIQQCRLCMENDSFQVDIFHEDMHRKQILMKMRTCLPVKIEKGDGLPCTICYKCLSQLDNSFNFWNESFNSEAILRHNLTRGRVYPLLKSTPVAKAQAILGGDRNSSDQDIYFTETGQEKQDNLMHSRELEGSFLGRPNKNMILTRDKPKIYLNSNISYPRESPIVEEPSGTNDTLSELGSSDYEDRSGNDAYFSVKKSCPKSKEGLKMASIIQKQKSYTTGTGTLWMDSNEVFPEEKYNINNKYIHKNLFGDDKGKIRGQLRKSQRKTRQSADLLLKSDDEGSNEKVSHPPWKKVHRKNKVDTETTRKSGSNSVSFGKNEKVISQFNNQDNFNTGRLQFDPNHCPKCNMTLTPSQNLLAHIQSHIQDD